MGVNVGDVIVDGDDIYGDGVNIAARIEALADPGGIFIARIAADEVRDKLPIRLESWGSGASRTSRARSRYSASPPKGPRPLRPPFSTLG